MFFHGVLATTSLLVRLSPNILAVGINSSHQTQDFHPDVHIVVFATGGGGQNLNMEQKVREILRM